LQISFGKNQSYQLDAKSDAIAISLSESGENYGNAAPSWRLDIYALTLVARIYVGTINTVAAVNGIALSRVIAYAICPGARGWAIEPKGPNSDPGGEFSGRVYAELHAHALICCDAFGLAPGVFRPLGRTIWNGVIASEAGADTTAPTADARTDFTTPIALARVFGSNESAARAWLMFFDSVGTPANGTQPLHGLSFDLAVGQSFDWTAPQNGVFFANGLTWALSTTPNTLTLAVGGGGARVTTLGQW
jgi:hypothetical protein